MSYLYQFSYLSFSKPIPLYILCVFYIRVTLPKLQFFIPVFLVMSIIYGNKFFIVILQLFFFCFALLMPYTQSAIILFINIYECNTPNETHRIERERDPFTLCTFSRCFFLLRVKYNYATSTSNIHTHTLSYNGQSLGHTIYHKMP